MLAGDDPVKAVSELEQWVVHVHAKDVSLDGKPCAPGEGCLDFQLVIDRLRSTGYEGFLSVEYEGDKDQLLGTGIGLGYLKALLLKQAIVKHYSNPGEGLGF